jgi:hypothetical protein
LSWLCSNFFFVWMIPFPCVWIEIQFPAPI